MINISNIKSYVINLEKYKNRYDLCLKRLSKINVKPERFNAIYVDNEYSDEIKKITYPSVQYTIKNGRFSHNNIGTKGAIGCYLSHVTLWKMLLESDEDMFLIFEDDVDINENINDIENKINKTLNSMSTFDWNIIYLGFFDTTTINMSQNPEIYFRKPKNMVYGTHAYLINKEGARKLLEKAIPIVDQIDSYISYMALLNNINVYETSEVFFIQNNLSKTTIQTDNSIRPFITQYDDVTLKKILIFFLLFIILLLILNFIKFTKN